MAVPRHSGIFISAKGMLNHVILADEDIVLPGNVRYVVGRQSNNDPGMAPAYFIRRQRHEKTKE
ncbi:MAG: hypothetical protein RBT76_14300 [candidate division Zixibacteria bacterium]|jgi:hypothetical protein|nr:hypothetical protein [candidate division Zixibacteria bacterium]